MLPGLKTRAFQIPVYLPGPSRIRRFFAMWLCALCMLPAHGQFFDDFNDGVIDGWAGDTDHFLINGDGQLQLSAPAGSTQSWLHVPVMFFDSMVWEVWLRLDFAPSASNQLRLMLGLDGPDPATASGYMLEIGANGDQDALLFYALDGGIPTLVAGSAPGLVAADPVALRLRITYDYGNWRIENLQAGPPALWMDFSHAQIPTHQLRHLGLQCRYTDTRRDKFRFDDIGLQPLLPDTTPPVWTGLEIADDRTLRLAFNEPLDPDIAVNTDHYHLTPGHGSPAQAQLAGDNVRLSWSEPFQSQLPYTLHVSGLTDTTGNVMVNASRDFTWVRIDTAASYDILFTEIMCDPTPAIGLPDAEFLELHNPTNRIFRLSDYTLRVGSGVRSLPDELLHPGEFIILCDPDDAGLFLASGRVVPVAGFPALTNSGATIALQRAGDISIHELAYTDDWYRDADKDDGGWTLEMINPLATCAGADNWQASTSLTGGTPGRVNSLWSPGPDVEGPVLQTVFAASDTLIILTYSEDLEVDLMTDPDRYQFHPAVAIREIVLSGRTEVHIRLSQSLASGILYQLEDYPAFDCLGNSGPVEGDRVFGLPVLPGPGDVIIHEILFNPGTGGSRFLEILNTTDQYIDLSSLVIGRINSQQTQLFPTGVQGGLGPHELAVFSPDPADILARYTVPEPNRLYTAPLPAWSDARDNVTLLAGGEVLDSLTYESEWHHPLIRDVNGVSLERISVSAPSEEAGTWHSASAASGYATPTGPNSQQAGSGTVSDNPFMITNPVFSPNNDGFNDFLSIQLNAPAGDQVASIWIYDLEGREVNRLLANELLGTTTLLQWDGRRADGTTADMGIYVIFIRLWDADGRNSEYRTTCALVQR